MSLWATYFDQRFRDMIVYDGSAAPGEPTYLNGAAARSRGMETGVTAFAGADVRGLGVVHLPGYQGHR